jgi:uncharacterized protein (TIGR03435 family)
VIVGQVNRGYPYVAVLLLVAAQVTSIAVAQTSAAQSATSPAPVTEAIQLHAPDPASALAPAFEVSAVKITKPGAEGSDSDFNDGRFTATNCTLETLIEYEGYGIPQARILAGPKWVRTEHFDIQAKMDDQSLKRLQAQSRDERRKQTRAMFQQLLADRFKLVVHWETRELPIYALVVARKGPALQATRETDGHSGSSDNNGKFSARGLTMEQLADTLTRELSRELSRPVMDKTGVAGRYDFALNWTPETETEAGNDARDDSASADAGPSIFTAIQEQMGLKLESAKGPVQVLVIDQAEMPQEN